MIIIGIPVIILELGFDLKAPYGKFEKDGLSKVQKFMQYFPSFPIPAKFAWFLQELPSLVHFDIFFFFLIFFSILFHFVLLQKLKN